MIHEQREAGLLPNISHLSPIYAVIAYGILCPVLLYGTSLGWINQSSAQLAAEIFSLLCVSLLIAIQKSNRRLNVIAFGLILLGGAMGSRLLSIWFPGINAMAAVVMLTGIYGGSHLGMAVGGLAPYLTNMMFLQGPWTPFQMYGYGILGLAAGLPLVARKAKESPLILSLFAGGMGIVYSLFMDTWTMLSFGSGIGWYLYQGLIIQAIPYTIKYIGSNIVFITLLKKPVAELVTYIEKRGMLR